jgi:hypothetical protein
MSSAPGASQQTTSIPVDVLAAGGEKRRFDADELDVWFFRHRHLLIGIYLLVFTLATAACATFFVLITDLPHAVFRLCMGDTDGLSKTMLFSGDFYSSAWSFAIAGAYVLLQAIALWGVGAVYVGRKPAMRRTTVAIATITGIGSLLSVGFVSLVIMAFQVAKGDFYGINFFWNGENQLRYIAISIGFGWVIWMGVAAFYWFGRSKDNAMQRLLRAILATSWIEFSLALPLDIWGRNRESCVCVIGSTPHFWCLSPF